jgi:hypothetical protein
MTTPNILPGTRFRLYRSNGDSPETFTFVCIGTTINLSQKNDFEDATLPDCDNPTATPRRKSIKRSSSWYLSFSGSADAARYAQLRADYASEVAVRYQILLDPLAGDGGGTHEGGVWFENLELAKNNNGIVTYAVTARGEYELEWNDAA